MDQQFSEELTNLLTKLKMGHNWIEQEVLALRASERAIFMEALEKKSKVKRTEFYDLIHRVKD